MYQVVVRLERSNDPIIKPYTHKDDYIYYVKQKHIRNFLVAFIKLHHTPGINPYSKSTTSKLSYLAISKLQQNDGYWWTSPTLHKSEQTPFLELRNFGLQDKDNIIYMNPEIHREYIKSDREEAVNSSEHYSSNEFIIENMTCTLKYYSLHSLLIF